MRFIIGANADLLGAVRAGRFREDLYDRVNVLPIRLPPLDERRDEMAQALSYEGAPGGRPLSEALRAAALAFVQEARRREGSLDLNLAVRQLGRESLVRNRNHHKALKREVEKVDALLKALGEAGSPFADLLALEGDTAD